MKERQRAALAVAVVMCTVIAPQGPAVGGPGGVATSMAEADAIVAVEILRTDYTATAADGPMYAEARVLGVVKGRLVRDSTLKFGETAWCGPDYRAGEFRVLFLQRVTSRNYFTAASWATWCQAANRVGVFFLPDALPLLSPAFLRVFMEDMQTLAKSPPRLKVTVVRRDQTSVVLSIGLINTGRQPLWLNPSKMTASFAAGKVRHTRPVRFAGGQGTDWTSIIPTQGISGTVTIARGDLRGQDRIVLQVTHNSVYFPYLSWAGTVSSAPLNVGK